MVKNAEGNAADLQPSSIIRRSGFTGVAEASSSYCSVVPSSASHSLVFLSTGPFMDSGCLGPPSHPSMDYTFPSNHLGGGGEVVSVDVGVSVEEMLVVTGDAVIFGHIKK
ncbi:unnamed protein product [Leuciscus chuanchicus]